MKILPIMAAILLVMVSGCQKSSGESPEEFPDCVGIEESFNPYNIQKAYYGRIWGQDTSIRTQFMFTDYMFDLSILRTSWMMYFKLRISPTRVIYQGADCFRSDLTKYWIAKTGFDFDGHYTSWDFYFEEFDCSVLSGYCKVIRPDFQDTLDFHFEGSR